MCAGVELKQKNLIFITSSPKHEIEIKVISKRGLNGLKRHINYS